jgi:hypothetical protein
VLRPAAAEDGEIQRQRLAIRPLLAQCPRVDQQPVTRRQRSGRIDEAAARHGVRGLEVACQRVVVGQRGGLGHDGAVLEVR